MKANVAIKEKLTFMVIDLETSLSTPLAVILSGQRLKTISLIFTVLEKGGKPKVLEDMV